MPKTIAELQRVIQHQEAVALTIAYVAEMLRRVPELEAALKAGPVGGISPFEDVQVFRKGLAALQGWFGPQEAALYSPPGRPTTAALKASLAALMNPPPAPVSAFHAGED